MASTKEKNRFLIKSETEAEMNYVEENELFVQYGGGIAMEILTLLDLSV